MVAYERVSLHSYPFIISGSSMIVVNVNELKDYNDSIQGHHGNIP